MPCVVMAVGTPKGMLWLAGSRADGFGISHDRASATIFPMRCDAQDAIEEVKRKDDTVPDPLVFYIIDATE